MAKNFVRRLWPDSLRGQVFLLLCLGMLLLQGIDILVLRSIRENYARQIQYDRVRNIDSFYTIIQRRPPAERAAVAEQFTKNQNIGEWNIAITVLPGVGEWQASRDNSYVDTLLNRVLDIRRSKSKDGTIPQIQLRVLEHPHSAGTADSYVWPILGNEPRPKFPLLEIAIQMDDGNWLSIIQALGFDDSGIIWIQRAQLAAVALVMAAILAVVLFRVARPLGRLGHAVERFGREPETAPPLPESGAEEIRDVSHSFNLMRQKILDNMTERDHMIVAMAHDLRTPLTRMQLRLENVEPELLRDKLLANCGEIKAIVQQSVDLARSREVSEEMVEVDLSAFLESMAEDAIAAGQNIAWKGLRIKDSSSIASPIFAMVRLLALKRCLVNLLDNAWRYGGGAELSASVDSESVIIEVADNGPGIGEEELKHVFEPYYRVESSRNRNTGGTGLGLTIARNMARLNSGDLELANRQNGGLAARLRLPRCRRAMATHNQGTGLPCRD